MAIKSVISFSLVIIILQSELAFTFSDCSDFAKTKNKVISLIRGSQCENSNSINDCEMKLGIGVLGASALVALAGAKIGKASGKNIRYPSFCLNDARLENKYLKQNSPFNIFFEDRAWALSCISKTQLLQSDLLYKLNGNIQKTKILITQQQELLVAEVKKSIPLGEGNANFITAKNGDKVEKTAKGTVAVADLQEKYTNTLASKYPKIIPQLKRTGNSTFEQPYVTGYTIDDLRLRTQNDINPNAFMQALDNHRELVNGTANEIHRSWSQNSSEVKMWDSFGIELQDGTKVELNSNMSGFRFDKEGNIQHWTDPIVVWNKANNFGDGTYVPKLNQVAPVVSVEQMKEHLEKLQTGLTELTQIQGKLNSPISMNPEEFTQVINKLSQSTILDPLTVEALRNAEYQLNESARSAAYQTAKEVASRGMMLSNERAALESATLRDTLKPSLKLKTWAIKSGLGLMTTAGFVSGASAANLENKAEVALETLDPMSAVIYSKDLGGNCSDVAPSLIPRNKEAGCNFDLRSNPVTNQMFLTASDQDLQKLFKDKGVCDYVEANYNRFFPKTQMQPVRCSPNKIAVNFSDSSSINLENNTITFKRKEGVEQLQYSLNEQDKQKPFQYRKDRSLNILSGSNLEKQFPEISQYYKSRLAVALEIRSCCNPSVGTTPSESDCGRYGIKLSNSSSGNSFAPDSSTEQNQ